MLYLSQLISFSELQALISESHTGLELIDFSVGMNLDRMEEYLLQWQDTLPRLGNPPLTIHGPFLDLNPMSFEPLTASASWTRFSQAYEAARILKADRIIFHTCRIPTVCYVEGWAKRLADFWNRFLEKHGEIPVCIENVFDESPEVLADFASRVQAENFSLCLDTGHANHASKNPLTEWLDILAPWITHLHLHDNHGVIDEHLAIGTGNIPWKRVYKKIAALPRLESATIENLNAADFRKSVDWVREKLPGVL